ncbi:hypothetical protein TEA_006221 [Camellia sinensis var. sinensis]|uniref:tRNA pseudouridine synthase n=1 Tax=Camellia sinensis var. sinensis TaxID=542762 RepID=A0A4S4D059_CAMSN|nr:hypothetical protein TEA_006221 [Camellia sinensis var. sinensis]
MSFSPFLSISSHFSLLKINSLRVLSLPKLKSSPNLGLLSISKLSSLFILGLLSLIRLSRFPISSEITSALPRSPRHHDQDTWHDLGLAYLPVVQDLLADLPTDADAVPSQSMLPPKPKRVKKAQPKAKAADAEAEDVLPISKLAESKKSASTFTKRSAEGQPSGSTQSKKARSSSATTSASKKPDVPWAPDLSLEDRPIMASESAKWFEGDQLCAVKITGTAFLWHQVRCMVAVLFLIGQGLESPNVIDTLLDIDMMPRKPQYIMAPEIPLVLLSCEFEGLRFICSSDARKALHAHLEMEYRTYKLQAAIFHEALLSSSYEERRVKLNSGAHKQEAIDLLRTQFVETEDI